MIKYDTNNNGIGGWEQENLPKILFYGAYVFNTDSGLQKNFIAI